MIARANNATNPQTNGNALHPATVERIQTMIDRGRRTKDITAEVGVSESMVLKIRRGRNPRVLPPAVWCSRCGRRVYPPCQTCRLNNYRRDMPRKRPMPSLRGIHDPELLAKLRMSVVDLGLGLRENDNLQRAGVATVYDLLMLKPDDLRKTPGVGEQTVARIHIALAGLGFVRLAASSDKEGGAAS